MENENEDNFRKLIQKAQPEKPGAAFTNAIMQRVQAASELDSAKEAALIQLLQSHTLVETPSANFSRRVMNQLTVRQSKPLEPIISTRVWYMIAASLLCVVVSCLLLLSSGSSQPTSSGLDQLLSGFDGTLNALPIQYALTIFAVSVLMVTDYILRQNRRVRV
ncbi:MULTISPECIES: hypothetical protein [unclassified Spirosoma]|uniref:hypothetical protein n=1 Tax=unclassified Spirosoma TaxID=2621999 RepID=UPI00095FF767|nr:MULTISPECIES: hypothetical protein [unclassified Spirosoma]MBN8824698.1 hypothetical protein [Spirosoma sp.]OJW78756.1 MAG: hypothetical protein BGO59_09725 [Spirosoma sp. 48-14]